MKKLRVLDLFSGIGGFSLGLERTGGFETVAFCEIEEFPRRVLKKHWPDVPCFEDVRTLKGSDIGTVDVITGGFPCQDISTAGRQAGISEGTRSGLWSEIARLVGELRPKYVIVENVANLLRGPSERPGRWFGRVLGDLAELRYDAEWHNIPASAVGAHHRRERVWVVAYPTGEQREWCRTPGQGRGGESSNSSVSLAYAAGGRLQRSNEPNGGNEGIGPRVLSKPSGDGDGSKCGALAYANSKGLQGRQETRDAGGFGPRIFEQSFGRPHNVGAIWRSEPDVGRVAHGIPDRTHRLKGLGNAVVPQIPELIGHAILRAEQAA